MRILLDNGEHALLNKGDIAMLQACLARLRVLRPDAEVHVVTASPWRLRLYAPSVHPVVWTGGAELRRAGRAGSAVRALLPPSLLGIAVDLHADRAGGGLRRLARSLAARRAGDACDLLPDGSPTGGDPAGRPDLHGADLVLALGGGWLTDVDSATTARILTLLETAADAGVATAMLSQGIGPLEDPDLRRRAADVLPRVDLIALREPLLGPRLLRELGVPPERVVVTGDDALELAADEPPIPLGRGIGVTLRFSRYSGLGEDRLLRLRRAVHAAAAERAAPLVEFVISEFDDEDRRATRLLTNGYPDVVREDRPSRPPAAIIRRVAGCRIVVTGTYHIAVFALARGIPVVCLSGTEYYDGKFQGLRALFGEDAVEVLALADPGIESALGEAIARMWDAAPRVRSSLLASARRQLEEQRRFYRRVVDLVPAGSPVAVGAAAPRAGTPAGGGDSAGDLALSVVIPARDAAATLPQVVERLDADTWDQPWEIVVADNGSTDGTPDVLARLRASIPRLRVVDASARPGAAYARNVGARAARGRSVAFFDADDVPHDGWVTAMGNALATSEFVACRIESDSLNDDRTLAARGRLQWDGLLRTEHPPYLPAASGGTIGIRRSIFLQVGGFDETLSVAGEDLEFCWRVQLAGYPLRFVPDAVVSMRFRTSLRDLFRQARRYGYGQPAVYERYRLVAAPADAPPRPPRPPSRLRPDRIAERLLELRDAAGRARWVWRCGWYTGVLEGSVRRHLDGLRG